MKEEWSNVSAAQKAEARFASWLSPPGVEFESSTAEELYKARVTRLKDAIQLQKKPDRIPLLLLYTFLPANLAGATNEAVMYNAAKLTEVSRKFIFEYEPDGFCSPLLTSNGPVLEMLGYTLYKWPGHGVPADSPYQYSEGEYMRADEYDLLIEDPTGFWMHIYLPRIFDALQPLALLSPLTNIIELPATGHSIMQFGIPEVQNMLHAMMKAGSMALEWGKGVIDFEKDMNRKGYPSAFGGLTKAPFDVIGDTLRGTKGMMFDMYRRPKKLLEALERITPIYIKMGVSAADASGNPIVLMPLHKGADGFMSDEQFKTFYWPSLKKVIIGLIEEGCVPMLFAEGSYDSRLSYLKELPQGKTVWLFDRSNMSKIKEELGDTICISGNVPASLIVSGTPDAVRSYCEHLIETTGKNGGFIMSAGTALDEARADNLKTMFETTRQLGAY